MSKKRRNFTSEFKSKIIIEMFENGMSINEMTSKYNLHPKIVQL
jgi:putative transposase